MGQGLGQGAAPRDSHGKVWASYMAEMLPVLPVCSGSLALLQGRGAWLRKPLVQPLVQVNIACTYPALSLCLH